MKSFLTSGLIAFSLLFMSIFAPTVGADFQPNFSSCPHPGGGLTASYSDGWHWIVGNSQLQWGSDSVYSIGNGNFVQCFCPKAQQGQDSLSDTQGIQTDWLNSNNISQDTRQRLISQGWMVVSNGADFGLLPNEYLAKNSQFDCNPALCNTSITQQNTTDIKNVITNNGSTGGNSASGNTGGSVQITTGSIDVSTKLTQIVNKNIAIGNSSCSSCNKSGFDISILGNGSNSSNRIRFGSLNR